MKKLLQINLKYFWAAPILLLFLSLVGLHYSSKLKLNLDLAGLLPENSESVQEMRHVVRNVGGTGYIIVLVGPITNPETKLPLIDEKIKNITDVKYTYYEREEYALGDKALFIIPKKDFKKLTNYARVLFAKGPFDSTGLGLDDESDRDEQIKEANKFFGKLKNLTNGDRYFLSNDKKYAMLLVRPTFDSTDLIRSKKLADNIRQQISSIFEKQESLKFPFTLSGRYVEKAQEEDQYEKDISKTSVISFIAVTVLLIWGLNTVVGALASAATVLISLCITGGLAYYFIGQINILTGFLIAILSGIGSKFGIHLIRRYYQEREKGLNREMATRNTYFNVGRKALFSSALTASCSFFILTLSKFRGFSELGIFAGIGIITIYIVFMLVFPFIARILPEKTESSVRRPNFLLKYHVSLKWVTIVSFSLFFLIFGLSRAYFEYDFDKMHSFPPEIQKINELTDSIFGRAISPTAILARDREQVIALSEWLRSDENAQTINQVVSLYDLLPPDMHKRAERISKLRSYVYKVDPKELEEKSGISREKILKWINATPYDRSIIPRSINDNFGKDGNVLIVFPKEKQSHYDAIINYAHTLAEAKKEFPGMEVGSDTLIFAEILKHIIEDGKLVIALFLVCAFFIFWTDFKELRDAIALEAQLVLCIIVLVALMGLFQFPFTILNVAMIPEVLAAGIDMGVHIKHREKEGHSSFASAGLVAPAVHLGAITSILGFGSLIFASSKMLQGIAWISILGQVSCYFVCMISFPLAKEYFIKHSIKSKRSS